LVDKLYDPNISKREYDKIVDQIGDRTGEIWRQLCKISNRKLDWWAFGNDVELDRGNGSTGGEFDPNKYKKWIEITGKYDRNYDEYDYDAGFPTEFLWTPDDKWQEIVIKNIKELDTKIKRDKELSKQKREELKERKQKMRKVIESKLTKEELKYILFK